MKKITEENRKIFAETVIAKIQKRRRSGLIRNRF